MTEDTDPLARRLVECGYAVLFGEHPEELQVESIKTEPDIGRRLRSIIDSPSSSWQARFMASQFLFRHVDMTLHGQCDRRGLADSYFQALCHNYTGNGVDWGFGKGPNDVGVLGLMVGDWGRAVEAFEPGLNDEHPLSVNFSWRPPPHLRPPYRIKDFAALILARAHGSVVDLAGSPEERDSAIAELKKSCAALLGEKNK